jgi:hypothetical protein
MVKVSAWWSTLPGQLEAGKKQIFHKYPKAILVHVSIQNYTIHTLVGQFVMESYSIIQDLVPSNSLSTKPITSHFSLLLEHFSTKEHPQKREPVDLYLTLGIIQGQLESSYLSLNHYGYKSPQLSRRDHLELPHHSWA